MTNHTKCNQIIQVISLNVVIIFIRYVTKIPKWFNVVNVESLPVFIFGFITILTTKTGSFSSLFALPSPIRTIVLGMAAFPEAGILPRLISRYPLIVTGRATKGVVLYLTSKVFVCLAAPFTTKSYSQCLTAFSPPSFHSAGATHAKLPPVASFICARLTALLALSRSGLSSFCSAIPTAFALRCGKFFSAVNAFWVFSLGFVLASPRAKTPSVRTRGWALKRFSTHRAYFCNHKKNPHTLNWQLLSRQRLTRYGESTNNDSPIPANIPLPRQSYYNTVALICP